ncbi:MAG TPA: dienelactone hydrolase family protein [Longimicrobiaceae bacterium]|nr:dienelactone hydrolase family protein [Longimicrobiaceae bacterium]
MSISRTSRALLLPAGLLALAACAARATAPADDHAGHVMSAPGAAPAGAASAARDPSLPAGAAEARTRLAASPRHGEWTVVRTGPADSVRAWVVYPERRDRAPVVLVVHEIFGLSDWIRAVADQLAADGFIAIAPDLLTMKRVPAGPTGEPNPDSARVVIRTLAADDVHRQLRAVADWGMALPAAHRSYGIVGFCWGGAVSFEHAVRSPGLGASVVYYGTSPAPASLASVRAPVLGLYGENDARVNATVPPADSAMRVLGKTFEPHTFPGAGHGFLRAQDGQDGANLAATRAAWPLTVGWFRRHLEPRPAR